MKKLLIYLALIFAVVESSAQSLNLPFGINVLNPKPVDAKYYNTSGVPYTDTDEVLSQRAVGIRYKGLTVNVDGVEYWFKDGTADINLVAKSGGWGLSGTTSLLSDVVVDSDDTIAFTTSSNFRLDADSILLRSERISFPETIVDNNIENRVLALNGDNQLVIKNDETWKTRGLTTITDDVVIASSGSDLQFAFGANTIEFVAGNVIIPNKADWLSTYDTKTTNYTAIAGDEKKVIVMNSVSPLNFTIPSATFSVGAKLIIVQSNVGRVTVVPSSITLNSESGGFTSPGATGQYTIMVAEHVSSGVWYLYNGTQLSTDLTTIASLTPSNDDFLQRKSGAWANRTVAQVKTDLGLTGTNSGDNAANTTSNTYADAKVADAINDGTTTIAPSQNAVFDALVLKAPLASPTFTGTPAAPTAAPGTNTTQLATTAFTAAGLALKPEILMQAQIVYVDSLGGNDATGVINRHDKPYLTIDAALDASTAFKYTIIKIGNGTYTSPTPAKIRPWSWFIGSGKPDYNSVYSQTAYATFTTTHPTGLRGGTVLRGTFQAIDKSHVKLYDLGIDCGPAYVTGGGTEGNQIGMGSNTASAPFPMITGIEIRNVTVLGRTASSAFHGIVLENVFEPVIHNVDTYYSTHGIAVKGIGGIIENVRFHQHTLDGLILKSDSYAFNWKTRAENLDVSDCGTGIIVQYGSGSQGNGQVSVYDAHISGCATGVKINALAGGVTDACHLENIRVIGGTTRGFDISTSGFTKINDCIVRGAGDGFYVRTVATTGVNLLENCMVVQASGDGFDVDAVGGGIILLTDAYATFCTGYGFNAGSNVNVAGYKGANNTAGLLNGTMTSQMINNPMTAVGDIIIGGTAGLPTVLADIASGNVLTTGGVGVAPAYGKVNLGIHVSSILPPANGGTNTNTVFTAGSIVFSGASGTYTQDNTNFAFDDGNNRLGIKRNTPLSSLDVDGSFGTAITTITTSTAVQETYHTILVDATSGSVTITLPVADVVNGREYVIKKIDASVNTVVIDGNGSELIDGVTTQTITLQNKVYKIQANATGWYITGSF